jgi:hypothetical protein
MYDGGFIKGRKKNQDENLEFPSKPGGGGDQQSFRFCKFFSALAGESTFSELGVARRFPGYGFSCISSLFPFLSRFLGKDFLLCVQVLGLQFPKGFSRLHFVRAFFFLQQGFSAFPSARFQHVSFGKVPACFLPARFCVCVLVLQCPWGFFGVAFPAYFL